jgi:Zn finger protein HypA/HybF involved in hydrogenase expression
MPGEECLHCGYLEQKQSVINTARQQMKTDRAKASCPRCNCPDAYTPGQPCLHCQYLEKDPQIIEMTLNAQLQIPRSALLRCPKCKNPDTYTPGENCMACGFKETNALLIKRSQEFRYRIIPLMPARDFISSLKTRSYTRSRSKYNPIAGALLEYEYAFTLLFSDNITQIQSLQNFYRVLQTLGTALNTVLKAKSVNDHNRTLLLALKSLTQKQFDALKQEFNKHNWALAKRVTPSHYPKHVQKKDYFQKATVVGDVLGALNGLTSTGFKAATLFWNISEAVLSGAKTTTTAGSLILAPFSVAENIVRGRRDAKLQKQFHGTAMKAGETILDLPVAKQKQMIADAINSNISSSQFASKWGGRIDYNNVKSWRDASDTHKKGKNRRTCRAVATVVGAALTVGAVVVTCGTAAIVLGGGATTISVLKVGDSARAQKKKMSKSEIRENAAKEIVNSAMTGEINAINLLGGLGIIEDPNHAKYLGFSDIYPVVVKEMKEFLNPA